MPRRPPVATDGQDRTLTEALAVVLAHRDSKREWLEIDLDLSFVGEPWRRVLVRQHDGRRQVNRRHLEVYVFSSVATELKPGTLAIPHSDAFADYREQLLRWADCAPLVTDYCHTMGLPDTAATFVEQLKARLTEVATAVDTGLPADSQVVISPAGEPVLKRLKRRSPPASAVALARIVRARMPERSLLDPPLCRRAGRAFLSAYNTTDAAGSQHSQVYRASASYAQMAASMLDTVPVARLAYPHN